VGEQAPALLGAAGGLKLGRRRHFF
jgi:hypothetical protein